jgi:hypothetical protein
MCLSKLLLLKIKLIDIKKIAKGYFINRDSNPGQLLGRQLSSPLDY